MSRSRWYVAAVLSTCVTPVLAQTFNEPTFYVWGWQRHPDAVVGNYLTNMVQVDGYGYATGTEPDVTPSPFAAAQDAANKIIHRRVARLADSGCHHAIAALGDRVVRMRRGDIELTAASAAALGRV